MVLRKWNSNSEELREAFEERPAESQKVLGLSWLCHNDELSTDVNRIWNETSLAPTKRSVLAIIAKFYDPLGLLGPFILKLKLLFQELWKLQLLWDEPIPHQLQTIWNSCVSEIPLLQEISIPRCIYSHVKRKLQELHVFADASLAAYGTVAYVRSRNEDDSVHVIYLCSKNRVAPLKGGVTSDLTLPKLELTAALIAARLATFLNNNLATKFDATYLWSDSQITLCWIHNDHERKSKLYVTARVQEIRQLTKAASWRFCPGNENPADLLTRGIKTTNESSSAAQLTHLFPIESYSRYQKVVRVSAYIFRFIDCVRQQRPTSKFITAMELQFAETHWIKTTQFEHFQKEVIYLKERRDLPRSSAILSLNPIIDDQGLLRVKTRLQESEYTYDEIYPILLPKSSYFTALLIQDIHERTLYGGVNVVLTRLREKFWIVKAYQLVKGIVKRCRVCIRLRGSPASQPIAPLPRERLVTANPFETTGIDFAGPLYVKDFQNDQTTRKVYIMVLTCAVLRAIHLEVVPSLTCESCILGLRRFFACRGIPKCMLSDNTRTFKRASLELRQLGPIIESEQFQTFASNERIDWKFIVERAAWWGGFWERLGKLVKDVLKATINRSTLTIDQFYTLLTEAESIINSRPLTYVGDDPIDLAPLTPGHFLRTSCSTIVSHASGCLTDKDIRAKWKSRLRLTKKFMNRFNTEYIQQLRSVHQSRQHASTKIEPGDVVIVYDQSTCRLFWKLAVVVNVFPGRDGKIRSCELRMSNGSILRRSIQHLYPLELQSTMKGPVGGC